MRARPTCHHTIRREALPGKPVFFSDLYDWAAFFGREYHCLTRGTRLHPELVLINCGIPGVVTNRDANGLGIADAPSHAPRFKFPGFPKRLDPAITSELHSAFVDLLEALEGEMLSLQVFGGKKATRAQRQIRRLKSRYPEMTLAQFFTGIAKA